MLKNYVISTHAVGFCCVMFPVNYSNQDVPSNCEAPRFQQYCRATLMLNGSHTINNPKHNTEPIRMGQTFTGNIDQIQAFLNRS